MSSSGIKKPQPPARQAVHSASTHGTPTRSRPDNGVSIPPALFSLTRPSTSTLRGDQSSGRGLAGGIPPPSGLGGVLGSPSAAPPQTSSSSSSIDVEPTPTALWRSSILKFEVALRELTSHGHRAPPSTERIEKVLEIYDAFTQASPHIGSILKMFRLEFCRAIFEGLGPNQQHPELGARPYFDRMDTMNKEVAILQAELDAVEADSSIEHLKKQLNAKTSLAAFYEHELTRLTREHKKATEEVSRMAADHEAAAKQNQQAFAVLDEECNRLNKENRELQLQVFKLGKDSREQAAGQGIYNRLKATKFESLQEMYEEGNEEACLLMLMYQLEALENESLDEFEADLFKSSIPEMAACRTKFSKAVELLLEEYHATEFRRIQLQQSSSNPASQKASQNPSRILAGTGLTLQALEDIHRTESTLSSAVGTQNKDGPLMLGKVGGEVVAVAESLPGSPSEKPFSLNVTQEDRSPLAPIASFTVSTPKAVKPMPLNMKARNVWRAQFFGDMYDRGRCGAAHLWAPAAPKLHQKLVTPLLDVSVSKFMTGLEIYTLTGVSGNTNSTSMGSNSDWHHLKTVNFIDPTQGIDLPQRSTQLRIKYTNPLIQNSVLDKDTMVGGAEGGYPSMASNRPIELPEPALWVTGATKLTDPNMGKAASSTTVSKDGDAQSEKEASAPGSPTQVNPALSMKTAGMTGPQWTVYRKKYGSFQPLLPRLIDVHHLDQLMLHIFVQHHQRLMKRFDACQEVAVGRSTGANMARTLAEKLFKEDYNPNELQNILVDTLETRYVFPEVAMKVCYEVLHSLDRHSGQYPYMRAYLDCLSHTQPPGLGFLLSLHLHLLSTYWPLGPSQAAEVISERDLIAVLKGLYPSDSLLKINIEELASDIMISCRKEISLNSVRHHIAAGILTQREPILHKLLEMFLFKAGTVHWSELDVSEFWETIRSVVTEEFQTMAVVKHSYACSVCRKPTRLPPQALCFVAADLLWTNVAKSRSQGI
jgi:hypothetical protein